jgi:hypothetical protein
MGRPADIPKRTAVEAIRVVDMKVVDTKVAADMGARRTAEGVMRVVAAATTEAEDITKRQV